MVPIRVYVDSSVYGGVFDEEFGSASIAFFDRVNRKEFTLVVSSVVSDELEGAPANVRAYFDDVRLRAESAAVTDEAQQLQEAYLKAGIVGPRWETDALHVALATVTNCRVLVSWNFKHIVHFQKIPLYNGVNLSLGYAPLAIHTPQEVLPDESEGQNI